MLEQERKGSIKTKIIVYLIRGVLRALLATCKIRIKGQSSLKSAAQNGSCMIMLWHNRLVLIGTMLLRVNPKLTYTAVVSNSKDGEILAQYTTSHKNGRTIRVPHDSREMALKAMISRLKLKREIVIVTPDGPRGPCYTVKPGIALAAKETGAAIIPFSWQADKCWELKTWDKMRIPKPFSTIDVDFGKPVVLQKESDLDSDLAELKSALQALPKWQNELV